jgi:AcrR family transcriptional regulator
MKMAEAAEKKARLGPRHWVDEGLKLLGEAGIDAVRVEVIAKRLKVTKGSFYWHFKDRPEYHAAMLDRWRKSTTTLVTHQLDKTEGSSLRRLKTLWSLATSDRDDVPGGAIEMSIREWSAQDDTVLEVLREVDRERLTYMTGLYEDCGLAATEARAQAFMFLSCVIGASVLNSTLAEGGAKQRLNYARAVIIPDEQKS